MIERNILKKLEDHILTKKTICVLTGARQTGKTTLLKILVKKLQTKQLLNFYLSLEDPEILNICNSHPENLFRIIPKPKEEQFIWILIDEVQYLENPSNFLKYLYDTYHENLRLIVSGSSNFYLDEKFTDSLAGRKRIYNLNTISFSEFAAYNGFEKIESLNTGNEFSLIEKRKLSELFEEYVTFGGYPEVVLEKDADEKQEILRELANSYIKKDALEAGIGKTDKYLYLMKILSDQSGSLLNSNELSNTLGVNRLTVDSYIRIMKISNHISIIRPFFRNVRKELTKMPKVYYKDSGLRNYLIRDFSPLLMRHDRGELLEQAAFRLFLDKYEEEDIQFWRTARAQEVDFVIGGKAAFEVKFKKEGFSSSKYRSFLNNYPDIPLNCINIENINTVKI